MRALVSGVLALLTGACMISGPPEWTVLAAPLRSTESLELPFVARQTGRHQVILDFAWPIGDGQVETLVTSAAATTGSTSAPEFDFSWQFLESGRIVFERKAPQRSTGVVETGTFELGGGPIRRLGLVFGTCDLESGRRYTLRFVPGAGLAEVAREAPKVLVMFQPDVFGDQ